MDQATQLRKLVSLECEQSRRRRPLRPTGDLESGSPPRVFAVTSGKGGVGKTNVVGNLAVACQRLGKKVLVLDADLGLANIDILFGINPQHTIGETIRGERDLSAVIAEGPEGVAVIPASSGVEELAQLSEGQKVNLLSEFDGLHRAFDLLLIDTGAGIASNVIFFNLAAEERIIVITPEPTSITDAYALIKVLFFNHGIKDFLLLSNMVKDESQGKRVYENLSRVVAKFMRGVCVDYAGCIPWDGLLQKSVSRRQPVLCCSPDSPSSRSFMALARTLTANGQQKPQDGNIKFFLKRLMDAAQDETRAQ
ncbi:MAG: MinD/ParA family protein [Desulfobacterota bacterium]|jgi:flagellar biosynthesis protein FlhG|nr:MinD/ParA family protein [Thermodesulfobacteriota bacterium]